MRVVDGDDDSVGGIELCHDRVQFGGRVARCAVAVLGRVPSGARAQQLADHTIRFWSLKAVATSLQDCPPGVDGDLASGLKKRSPPNTCATLHDDRADRMGPVVGEQRPQLSEVVVTFEQAGALAAACGCTLLSRSALGRLLRKLPAPFHRPAHLGPPSPGPLSANPFARDVKPPTLTLKLSISSLPSHSPALELQTTGLQQHHNFRPL
jgi:hypothetical protein